MGMERIFKGFVLLTLVALVVTGVTGCRKKGEGLNGEIDGGIVLTTAPDISVFETPLDTQIYRMIHFDYDKSDIKPEAKPILENIAIDLKATPGKYLLVEGHCDERGTNEYNLALGEKRALNTREYLANLGVDPEMIVTISYGEEQPLELGHDESAWRVNRRAEFKTYTK